MHNHAGKFDLPLTRHIIAGSFDRDRFVPTGLLKRRGRERGVSSKINPDVDGVTDQGFRPRESVRQQQG